MKTSNAGIHDNKKETKTKQLMREFWRDRKLLMLLIPMFVLLFVFSYLPIYGILISFQNYKIGRPIMAFDGSIEWVGFKYFIKFFNSVYFERVMRNTLTLSIYGIVFGFWVPIAFALILNELQNQKFKRVVQTVSYLPHFISSVVIVGIVVNMLSSVDGVINHFIELFGGTAIQFLNEPAYFKPIFIIMNIWTSFGWNSVLYLANIASIDQTLYEAAKIDGANRWQQMIHVTLPGIAPTITILLILSIGGLMSSDTQKIILLYNPATYDTADVISTYTLREGIYSGNYSYAAAIGFFTTVLNFILLTISNKISKKVNDFGLW